jgi:hypothetical protein
VRQVIALKPGMGLDYVENYRAVSAAERLSPPAAVRLVLDGAQPVTLKAADADGWPIAGAEVVPMVVWKRGKLSTVDWHGGEDWFGPARAVTDARGVAVVAWVPVGLQRSASFNFSRSGYQVESSPCFHLDGRRSPA